jgi:Transposase zinc-binding domain
MNRPTVEVADIVRQAGPAYIERHRSELAWPHLKVLEAIQNCRTAALGGHLDSCLQCGYQAISYNSCRHRHCPKCQTAAREQWLTARSAELLPVPYYHVVFTLPRALSALVLQNKRLLYNLLFRTSAETLLAVAADPRHLGARIGFLSVLHSGGQRLDQNPHS